jgi:hypothetical protein
VGLQIWAEEDL